MLQGFTSRLFTLSLFLALPAIAFAQRPGNTRGFNKPGSVVLGQKMDCNDAGDLGDFFNFAMQSNSFGAATRVPFANQPDTIFLCFDDQFSIEHAGGQDLSGDPDATTTPGVGYAFYECAPTASGPLIDDIRMDPCVADGGLPPFDRLTVGVPVGYLGGNYTFTFANDDSGGTIPDLFPDGAGEPTPVVFQIAPITFDDASSGEAAYDTDAMGVTGPCVNVRLDQAFTVAYLNPINVRNLSATNASCNGSFTVRGGAPELRGSTGYTIVIENTATMQRATLDAPSNTFRHNDVVNYEVPVAGDYRILIMDEVSCELMSTTVNHQDGCANTLLITFPTATAAAGATQCFPVTVDNFTDILSTQFEIAFDPAVLSFTGINNANPLLTDGIMFNGPPSSGGTRPDGSVVFSYGSGFNSAATIPDGGVFFELCFEIIGSAGDQSPVINNTAFGFEFTRDDGTTNGATAPIDVNNGIITVSSQDFLVTTSRANETCDNFNDGSITVTASNTAGPLVFSFRRTTTPVFGGDQVSNNVPATVTFENLADGDYEVRVTNGNGEIRLVPVTIDRGTDLAVNVLPINQPSCNGFTDGSVRAEVLIDGSVVTNPLSLGYTFAWEGFSETSDVLSGLSSGRYEVTVTSPNGFCTSSSIANLSQPLAVTVRPDNPASAVSSATCDGAPDGSIDISADGGTGPYNFDWPGGIMDDAAVVTSTRTNLLPGEYAVTVTDTRGCADTANFVVDALKRLEIVSSVDSISCFEETDGVIRVNGSVSGAARVGSYFVTLDNLTTGAMGTEQEITDNSVPFAFNGLAVGEYTVTLRDDDPAGCSIVDTFEVGGPEELVLDDDLMLRDETCSVGMDGSATATVTGGTLPYVYRWVNDSLDTPLDTITPGPLLDGLQADTNYVVTITDARGCTQIDSFRINAPAAAQIDPITPSFISCPGDTDGQLFANITNAPGVTTVSITWYRVNPDTTLGAIVATGAMTQADLGVGVYAVEVITSNDCINFGLGVVNSPSPVFLQSFETNNPDCPGDANGNIFVNPGGGTPNDDGSYNYLWSNNLDEITTTPVVTNLTAGTYSVTIVDANNCQPAFDTTFVITDPPAIVGQFDITNVSCPDDDTDDGQATFTAAYSDGTQGSYNFTWTSGTTATSTTSSTDVGLPRGPISVRVSDAACSVTFDTIIGSPEEFVAQVTPVDVSCNGLMDGGASINVTGGTGTYTFIWTGSTDTDDTVENLPAGTDYEVIVTDANGCSPEPIPFVISQPDSLTLAVDPLLSSESVSCAGDMDGRISVFLSSLNNNDLGPEPYQWSGNIAPPGSSEATNLAPGTYGVTVTDVEGCQDSLTYTITEPELITFAVLEIMEPACFGETTPIIIDTAFGGQSTGFQDFTFSVNNDGFRIRADQESDAFAGEIVVTVFDAAGCFSEQTFSVGQPPQIVIDLEDEITIELGDSLTRLNPIVSPVADLYSYVWTPADFLSNDSIRNPLIFPFADRAYNLEVTNMNGCQAFADIFVNVDANRNVYIPNVFSPNRDGRNEDFRVFACQGVASINTVQIYDRWGGLMFEADNLPPNCLDGIQLWNGDGPNGKPVNSGVFVYMVEVSFLDGATLLYRGDVSVVR